MKRITKEGLDSDDTRQCQCGCGQKIINKEMVNCLYRLCNCLFKAMPPIMSDKQEIALYITSWNRCKKHNKDIGGAKNSLHIKGKAVDFAAAYVLDGEEYLIPADMVAFILDKMDTKKNEIITYEKGRVHFGISDKKIRGDNK